MKNILYKIFIGKPEYNTKLKHSTYHSHIQELVKVWNNQHHTDVGMEKILRLFLIAIQFIFPGLHIRNISAKGGLMYRNLATEFYVLFKTVLPLFFLYSGLYKHTFTVVLSIYFLFETLCYVASLIFVSDSTFKPRSYRRNILMLFLNFLEIVFAFGVIYAGLGLLNGVNMSPIDYIYFSIVTATTIGYGDLHTHSDLGKLVVCIQAFVSLSFVVLFLNFFGSKVETFYKDGE